MKLYILMYLCIFSIVKANNQENDRKFEKYRKCMRSYGISPWKIVSSISNATSYNMLNHQWNKIFDVVFPIAIFAPTFVSDVQATVVCGYKAGIQLVPNSGGHSYAGLSIGTNDSIVIDFRYMNSIEINYDEESATVGAGALVGNINAKLWSNGGFGTPLGICTTVAIGGHGLGGGYSFFSGVYGLVIDNLLEIEMVGALGEALTVNPCQNSDLWWAMRGVGPGYIGLVTSYKLKLFRARDVKATFVRIVHKVKDFQNVVGSYVKWLDWVKQNNELVTSIIVAQHDNRTSREGYVTNGVDVYLMHVEDPWNQPKSSDAILAAYPKYFTNSSKVSVLRDLSYIRALILTGYSPVNVPEPQRILKNFTIQEQLNFLSSLTKGMTFDKYSLDKSFYVSKKVRTQDLDKVQKIFANISKTCEVWLSSEQEAVGIPRSTDSAYVHREAIFNLRAHCGSSTSKTDMEDKKWMDEFLSACRFMDNGLTYANSPSRDLTDYLQRYYGKNLEKLIQIKTKWDPNGYFSYGQSIPTIKANPKANSKANLLYRILNLFVNLND